MSLCVISRPSLACAYTLCSKTNHTVLWLFDNFWTIFGISRNDLSPKIRVWRYQMVKEYGHKLSRYNMIQLDHDWQTDKQIF